MFEVVTQISNLLFRRLVTGGVRAAVLDVNVLAVEGSADGKSAIRQVTNLRYVVEPTARSGDDDRGVVDSSENVLFRTT